MIANFTKSYYHTAKLIDVTNDQTYHVILNTISNKQFNIGENYAMWYNKFLSKRNVMTFSTYFFTSAGLFLVKTV